MCSKDECLLQYSVLELRPFIYTTVVERLCLRPLSKFFEKNLTKNFKRREDRRLCCISATHLFVYEEC